MFRTGHTSIEGVRTYKRISDNQKEVLSDVLNSGTNVSNTPPTKTKTVDNATPADTGSMTTIKTEPEQA